MATDDFTQNLLVEVENQILAQTRRIDFYITEYSIEHLSSKMHHGEYEIPHYQRAFTWDSRRKSRFIESVFLGLPIPFLFFWENPTSGRLEIVDGSQRLRTLEEFVYGDFQISQLEVLDLLNELRYSDILESRQRKFLNRSIRGIVLTETTDEQSRLDLFERLNTGSLSANPTEVRRGALAGPFLTLVGELSATNPFKSIAPMTEKQRDLRENEELITRFFAYGDGLDNYKDNVSSFLYNYTKEMNRKFHDDPNLEASYRQRFQQTMQFVEKAFEYGFRRTPKGKTTPRARFEAIAIGSFEAIQDQPTILHSIPDTSSWAMGKEFGEIVGGDGANAIGRLRRRTGFVRNQLVGCQE